MKSLLISLLLSLIFNSSYSQINELAIAKCEYKFIHRYDTTNIDKKITETYTLLLGKSASVYYSKDREIQDSLMIQNSKKTGSMAQPSGRRYNSERIYFFQKNRNFFISSNSIIGNYIVEKSFPKLEWTLYKDTVHYGNYTLNKATTKYHGRNYICWYAPSLPFKAGPWKLNGLPGLIFKAYDETNRISFELTNFTQTNANESIKWKDKYKNISWDEYLKLVYFFRDDPDGFIQSKFPGIHITSSQPRRITNRTILDEPSYVNYSLEDKKYLFER